MKITAWNLNHRILEKAIPRGVLDVVGELAPDVLVLNEYVDGDGRREFKSMLSELGLGHISVSQRLPRHNHVLIASRAPHLRGTIAAPATDTHAETNFHSAYVGAIEVVGIRAPAYEQRPLLDRYWRDLRSTVQRARRHPVLLIGDMNGDPENPRSPAGVHMSTWLRDGWRIPVPSGPWSFPLEGGKGSRIDQVIANEWVGPIEAAYVCSIGAQVLAGGRPGEALSDHAAIVAELKAFDWAGRYEDKSGEELILHLAAEGGGLDLVGRRAEDGWVYRCTSSDWTPGLRGEEHSEQASPHTTTWEGALELLDRYPWPDLSPTFVHPEFRSAFFAAVENRFRAGAVHTNLGKWKAMCDVES